MFDRKNQISKIMKIYILYNKKAVININNQIVNFEMKYFTKKRKITFKMQVMGFLNIVMIKFQITIVI